MFALEQAPAASDKPLVTALINTFNYARYLPFAINSVLAQTYDNIEIIVVDDGSFDHTAEVLAQYGDRIKVIVTENGGQGQAFNVGIMAAQGELIMLLDADDLWLPRKVERMVQLAADNPDCGFLYHKYVNVDSHGNLASEPHPEWMISGNFRQRYLRSGAQYWHPITTVLTLRTAFARTLLPLPTYAVREGADSIIADCSMLMTNIASTPEVLAQRLLHGANLYAAGREDFDRTDTVRIGDVRRIEWRTFYIGRIVEKLGFRMTLDLRRNEWIMTNLYLLDRAPLWRVAWAFILNTQVPLRDKPRRLMFLRDWKRRQTRRA
ncbi:MAG: glucosyl transferase [Alphaproteobacteria bacterium]|jgi:glycosyltransferase involved in cell wall biosynthesis|nr:glucosyl transferase [Alphaproteobacteria bacterium]